MGNIIEFVQNNWVEIVAVYGSIVTIASLIVKFTPTLKDDNALKAVVSFIGKYIALNSTKGHIASPNA